MWEDGLDQLFLGGLEVHGDDEALDQLGDLGADVVKIEPPQGEPLRRRAPPGKSTTFPIAMLNSSKRAITLNLKDERGRGLLFRMVERGDVLHPRRRPGRHRAQPEARPAQP